jgi:hypothetical protein
MAGIKAYGARGELRGDLAYSHSMVLGGFEEMS